MANTKTIDTVIAARKKVTDGAYIPIMQTDGTLAQIATADLAKVVGGLNRISFDLEKGKCYKFISVNSLYRRLSGLMNITQNGNSLLLFFNYFSLEKEALRLSRAENGSWVLPLKFYTKNAVTQGPENAAYLTTPGTNFIVNFFFLGGDPDLFKWEQEDIDVSTLTEVSIA